MIKKIGLVLPYIHIGEFVSEDVIENTGSIFLRISNFGLGISSSEISNLLIRKLAEKLPDDDPSKVRMLELVNQLD